MPRSLRSGNKYDSPPSTAVLYQDHTNPQIDHGGGAAGAGPSIPNADQTKFPLNFKSPQTLTKSFENFSLYELKTMMLLFEEEKEESAILTRYPQRPLAQFWISDSAQFGKVLKKSPKFDYDLVQSVNKEEYWDPHIFHVSLPSEHSLNHWMQLQMEDFAVFCYCFEQKENAKKMSKRCRFYYFLSERGQIIMRIVEWIYYGKSLKDKFSIFEVEDVNLKPSDTAHFRDDILEYRATKGPSKSVAEIQSSTIDPSFKSLYTGEMPVMLTKQLSMDIAQKLAENCKQSCIYYEDAAELRMSPKITPGKMFQSTKGNTRFTGVLTFKEKQRVTSLSFSSRIKHPYKTFYESFRLDGSQQFGLLWTNWLFPFHAAWIIRVEKEPGISEFVPYLPVNEIKNSQSKMCELLMQYKTLITEYREKIKIGETKVKNEDASEISSKFISGTYSNWIKWSQNAYNAFTEDFKMTRDGLIKEIESEIVRNFKIDMPELDFREIVGGILGTAKLDKGLRNPKNVIQQLWRGTESQKKTVTLDGYLNYIIEMKDEDIEKFYQTQDNVQANNVVIFDSSKKI